VDRKAKMAVLCKYKHKNTISYLLSLFLCKYKHKNTISYLQVVYCVGISTTKSKKKIHPGLSGAPENLAQEVSKDFILFSFQNQRGKRVHINKYFKKDKSHQKY
jgi:hypothetical protein